MNPNETTPQHVHEHEVSFFTANVIGALIVGLIVGFAIGAYYTRHASKAGDEYNFSTSTADTTSDNASSSSDTASVIHSMSSGDNEVSLGDVQAGSAVTISKLTLGKTYWIAVRDSISTTKTPYILGARRIQKGTYSDIVINLSGYMSSGKSYDIVLFNDKGASFDYSSSNLVNENSPALATFKVK